MVVAIFLLFIVVLITAFIGIETSNKEYLCLNCKHKGVVKNERKGNTFLEIILWFVFLIPGMIYTIWRNTSRINACTLCASREVIPTGSPRAEEILNNNPQYEQTVKSNKSVEQLKMQEVGQKNKEINKTAYALISVLLALILIIVATLVLYVIIDYKMKNPF